MRLAALFILLALSLIGGCDSSPVTSDNLGKAPANDARTAEAKTSDAKTLDPKTLDAKTPATVAVPTGLVTSETLVSFLPATLGGAPMEYRQAVDQALAAASYRTPRGYINVNLAITRDISFDRAQIEGATSDEELSSKSSGISKRGIAVGPHRALLVTYRSGSKVELLMLFGERISMNVSREGNATADEMVALASELDLAGLAGLASRVPAPPAR